MYGRAFFKNLNFNAITVSPYMGKDSITPFLDFKNKWVIILALTSNNGSVDFQKILNDNDKPLFSQVLEKSEIGELIIILCMLWELQELNIY